MSVPRTERSTNRATARLERMRWCPPHNYRLRVLRPPNSLFRARLSAEHGSTRKTLRWGREERQGEVRHVQSIEFDNCTELVAAVGEASYQPALRETCGSKRWERVRLDCTAALASEPSNSHDANAVAVYADCRGTHLHVGYLSRGDALDYQGAVRKAADMGYTIICRAHIAGREQGSETPNLGIFLDLPTPDPTPRGRQRPEGAAPLSGH